MLEAAFNAFRIADLRRKILFTLGVLIIFRFIATVPVPGVDRAALQTLLSQNQLLGMLNLFSGSTLKNFSILAMGVYPYITASIIMQLLTPIIPRLNEMQQEGQQGRNRINKITHYITVPIALLQAYGQCVLMQRSGVLKDFGLFDSATWFRSLAIVLTLVAGTILLVWLGELITENGVGNGVSIIIFGGIVASLPGTVGNLIYGGSTTQNITGSLAFVIIGLVTIVGIVLLNEGQRRIPVHHAKRVRRGRSYGGGSTFIPLKVNSAGMIPLIFAVSIMVFPGTIANFMTGSERSWVRNLAESMKRFFDANTLQYQIVYFLMVVAFTYFYTMVVFQQQSIAENLQRQGAFIPGIRPGANTNRYLTGVVTRITLVGALGLGLIAILPYIAAKITGVQTLFLGATSLLIVVGVAIDTMRQLEAQLMMRNYEGFIR
ncbi:MAG TPA: preprotein translocase subunit SecY [Thermomicrobiales bacterium]|nr:preprotein translocase subunit SecY [Chloroflexota bacterium]HQZ89561.1 preprotein translocase subunit SecY [Thermomicrobiales bacterium]HRA31142.1 preprotein translocase subunit SecY [Thermomicrobiales bacterium]